MREKEAARKVAQKVIQKVGQKAEQKVDQKVDQKVEQKVDQKVEQKVDQKAEQKVKVLLASQEIVQKLALIEKEVKHPVVLPGIVLLPCLHYQKEFFFY